MMEKKKMNINVNHGGAAFFTDNITVSHGKSKFVVDFTQTVPRFDNFSGQMQQTLAINHNTILMDARMAKVFLQTLQNNVKNYEKKFGKIDMPKMKKGKKAKSLTKPLTKKAKHVESSSRYIG
jgi:hypothetical protein